MHVALLPHPAFPAEAVTAIEVVVGRPAFDALSLDFRLSGAIARILIPEPSAPERTDGLWQHTCFEAFVSPGQRTDYHELNLSPATRWAGYRFDAYRSGMRPALDDPGIRFSSTDGEMKLSAVVRGLPTDAWRIGLSAVIEARDGSRSFWALQHPPGQPDFHHEDCFALRLPPAA